MHSVLLRICNASLGDDSEQAREVELDKILHGLLGNAGVRFFDAEAYIQSKNIGGGLPCERGATRHAIRHNVTKFVRTTDQILSLASFLLKSEAFFLAHQYPQDSCVQLPRTEHQKPFIPTMDGSDFPISVSHQWPFVGISRFIAHGTNQSLLVGLDIVVFERLNTRLYRSVREFVAVFKESFTGNEWQIINKQNENDILHEFYTQWSVKEAVTKAIGVGLGFDFSSFEVEWDFASPESSGLWDTLMLHGALNHTGLKMELKGTIVPNSSHKSVYRPFDDIFYSRWVFSFLALSNPQLSDYEGVACTCLGPFDLSSEFLNESIEWNVEWTDVQYLLSRLS